MNYNKAEFYACYGLFSQIPESDRTEIVFAGRSNVGKSTLINKIFNRKALARVSSVPGKTATINFYSLEDVFFVDLPGYGYAKVAKTEKQRWAGLIEGYLNADRNIELVFLLVDIRHAPSKNDCMMYDWMVHYGFKPVVVATKLDKIKRSQLSKQVKLVRETLGMGKESPLIAFSAVSKQGRDEIYELIDNDKEELDELQQ